MKFKHKIGTKLRRKGHINITIVGIDNNLNYYLCEDTDTGFRLTLTRVYLNEPGWINTNPIWLNRMK